MANNETQPAQYGMDLDGLAGEVDASFTEHTYDGKGATDENGDVLHDSNLFDVDEDGAGELYNPATGRRYDNSTYTGLEGLTVGQLREPRKPKMDEADLWLAANEPKVKPAKVLALPKTSVREETSEAEVETFERTA